MAIHHIFNLKSSRCALGAAFLVIAQVQALSPVHAHSRDFHHEQRSWDRPTSSFMQGLRNQAGAAGSRRISAHSYHSQSLIGQPHEERSLAEVTEPRRAVVPMERARRSSRQQMEALMSFRANVSNAGMTFQNWDVNDSTPCGWTGVSCSRRHEHVIELNLPSRRLAGSISSAMLALSKLPSLTKLDLSDNNFTSFISGPCLVNFSSLAFLNLSYNQVSGDLPEEIGEVSNLQLLILAGNSLSGPIPPSVSNCSMLRTLDMESNLLVSHIPEAIGRLTHLQELFLGSSLPATIIGIPVARNQILGPIPSSLGNCSSLTELRLTNNPTLQGKIPWELSQLHSLQVLFLFNCNLEGVFPQWIVNLTRLVVISSGFNRFHGSIPAELGRLPNMSRLSLENNFLVGITPPEIGNCTSLAELELGNNFIGGIIPSSLRNCSKLVFLSFGMNPLMGPQPIPPWIASLTNLKYLDFKEVNLHGKIPNDIGRLSKLIDLELHENWLIGSVPSSLLNCSLLVDLLLDSNNLTGRIPSKIGVLSNLIAFTAHTNNLIGSIPSSITNLTQLFLLDIGNNMLGGTIDGEWGQLSQLEELSLWQNQHVGSIPRTLSYCSNLVTLDLENNQLKGEVPAGFGNLSRLERFSIRQNKISGKVPANLRNCSFLSYLIFNKNLLEGPLPDLSNLPLLYLDLDSNKFAGAVPDWLANLAEIVVLDLSRNRFNGSIPGETISRLRKLTYINLSHNLLSGSLSPDWRGLIDIEKIDVSNNNISGSIPRLDQLKGLQGLDLSRNNFSGQLPQELASLPNLVFFNASYNNFVGPIPSSRAFDSNFTTSSFLGNPGLCGGVLGSSRACPQNVSESHSGGHCEGFRCARVWIPTLVTGVACVFLAAAAVVCWCWMTRRAAKKSGESKDIFKVVNFKTFHQNLKLAPADILAVIGDERNKVGSGSQSVVYKGSLPGWGVVAIKSFFDHENEDGSRNSMPSNVIFWQNLLEREANLQASLRHRNILEVLCFCENVEFRAVLLEYMPRGSLERHLHPSISTLVPDMQLLDGRGEDSDERSELPWGIRFRIALDVAEGMKYLHHDCPEPLIHGDLKPSNILLDDQMVAKVADFGISKLVNLRREGEPGEASVSNICGTVGYMPPEYAFVTTISTKGDVFSYGILLLEMLSGRSPMNGPFDVDYRGSSLHLFQNDPLELLDTSLQQEGRTDAIKSKQMLLLAKVAFFCTRENPQSRPSMTDVRSMLIQIQEGGMEELTRKTMSELLESEDEEADASNGVNTWENDDPNAIASPSISLTM